MARYIERGDSLFIPFRNGKSISDSQCRPRMYKSMQNFEKSFPTHNLGARNIEMVVYAEVKHGKWKRLNGKDEGLYECSNCYNLAWRSSAYCPLCGAKMDGGKAE